ncbi:MAG: glycosyltransferase family 4 protein [Bacteroidetes bacterium]|nr:glycosyltransferase family 4 protein [Bacteroidota bacterium]
MKILYSCLSKSWGGMEIVTINSIKQLLDRNISVELICTAESRIHIEANNIGMIIYPIKAPGYFHPIITIKVVSIIKNGKYDLIHTHASKDLWLLVPALKLIKSKTPLVLTKHVGSFIKKTDKMHNWLYSRVNYAIAISKVIKENLLETTALDENRIILHYNGVDPEKYDPDKIDPMKVRNELNIKEDELLLGMVARFSAGKGHENFLLVAKELSTKYNDLKFIIVGEASKGEDAYAKEIKNLADDYGLNNIIFTGFRTDMPQVLSAMDIFIFPSHAEAFGVALVEAMAMAKPSVSTSSDGILDITVDNETGYLFNKDDPADLKSKLELLINSPEKRKTLGKAARQRVLEQFDSQKLMDGLVELYKQFIKR